MRILIADGKNNADYVIREFLKLGHQIVVINNDEETARELSERNGIEVINSDPTKIFSFVNSEVDSFDLVVALSDKDDNNFVICQIAKKLFNIKKAICVVSDPEKVAPFFDLGIDAPISSSKMLAERIKGESDLDSLFKTLSLENEKIVIVEIYVKPVFSCSGKALKDLNFPAGGNICCIYRNPQVIIPRGDTSIESGDTLVIACTPSNQDDIIGFIKRS